MSSRYLRLFLLRWHRRIGVLLMGFVALWVSTGIAINHTDSFKLDQRFVRNAFVLARYGIETPVLDAVKIDQHFLSALGGQLFIDGNPVANCRGTVLGAARYSEGFAVLCEEQLLLFTEQGELLDDIVVSLGLPVGAVALTSQAGDVFLATAAGDVVRFDPHRFVFVPVEGPLPGKSAESSPLPASLSEQVLTHYRGEGVSWERLLLDLHSGRFFGPWGVIVVDIAALLLGLIALAGVWVWMTKPGRWRH